MKQFLRFGIATCIATLGLLLLASCASSSSSNGGPYNVSTEGADSRLMLNGFDPVAYHVSSKHIRGATTIKTEHDGVTYRFENEANKATFLKEPNRYVPQYGGFCANGIVYGIPWGGDGDAWKIIDGKLFIFGGQASKNYFLLDEAANLKLADQYWQTEVNGANAIVQRYKRLALRVPHYKSGGELEQQWQQRQKP
jgi:YHS domain-containing protein